MSSDGGASLGAPRVRRTAAPAVGLEADREVPNPRHALALICAREEDLMGRLAARLIAEHGVAQADALAILAPMAAHTGGLIDAIGEAWGLNEKTVGEALRAGHDLLVRRTSSSSQGA